MKTFGENNLGKLWRPSKDSHKGQNGRVLVIGGSKLFHTSIFWSADVASRVVDLVHFTSPANENNEVVRKRIKEGFWSGIVVDWGDVEQYIQEDDVVLIGPGMVRAEGSKIPNSKFQMTNKAQMTDDSVKAKLERAGEEDDTGAIVNALLKKYPEKRWVVDGGAVQEINPSLLNSNHVITPHLGEWERLMSRNQKSKAKNQNDKLKLKIEEVVEFSRVHGGVTVLLKNVEGKDVVCRAMNQRINESTNQKVDSCVVIEGGNEGLTKGGTGDVLAGLAAGFYAENDPVLAASAASYLVKKAADWLYEEKKTFYNAGDLVEEIGKGWGMIG